METKILKLKLFSAIVKTKSGQHFTTYYSYPLFETSKGHYEEIKTNVNGQMKMLTYRTYLTDKVKDKLVKDNNFPYILTLDDSEVSQQYYVTVDKDKDKVIRLDKNGKKRNVIVINDCLEYEHFTPSHKSVLDMVDADDIK